MTADSANRWLTRAEIEVGMTVLRLTRLSLTTGYEFRRGDVVLAVGEMKTAYCLIPAGSKIESAEMPSEYFDQLTEALEK